MVQNLIIVFIILFLESTHKDRETALIKSEEGAMVEVEKLKAKNDSLVDDLKEMTEKLNHLEGLNEQNGELDIKNELNTFESLLQCEEARLGLTPKRSRKRKSSENDADLETPDKKKCRIM